MKKAVIAFSFLAALLFCCQPPTAGGPGPTASPAASPSPTPTSSPTPPPVPAAEEIALSPKTLNTNFGNAISICGNYALVGASFENNRKGAAYLFKYANGAWSAIVRLVDTSSDTYELYGYSVKLTADKAYVGAYKMDRYHLQPTTSAGGLDVYQRDGDNLTRVDTLYADKFIDPNDRDKGVAPDSGTNECYGYALSVGANVMLVSNPTDDGRFGAVYAYYNNQGSWFLEQKMTAGVRVQDSGFGNFVCLAQKGSQIYAIVGAPADTNNAGTQTGAVYVFKREWKQYAASRYGNVWTQVAKIFGDDAGAGDCFGWSVAANDKYIFAGNWLNNTQTGKVYVFALDEASGFPQADKILPTKTSAGMRFGMAVAVSGDNLLVGATRAQPEGSTAAPGAAYLFKRNSLGAWVQERQVAPASSNNLAGFGTAVDIDATRLLAGTEELSAAYAFRY